MTSAPSPTHYQSPWNKKSSPRVVVIGDIMLDEYLEGSVSRISPEAPVPVHLVNGTSHRAGGAANVALSLAALGVRTDLLGVWGEDESKQILSRILTNRGVNIANVCIDETRPTTRKTRVTASRHQMLRLDWEESRPLRSVDEKALLKTIQELKDIDVLVLSDYGKGLLTSTFLEEVRKIVVKKSWITIVDPKGNDYHRYKGFDIITPNKKEALEALGESHSCKKTPDELAKELQRKFSLDAILITLGAEGMYFNPSQKPSHLSLKSDTFKISAHPVEVFDVSGAGDTVVAVLALALASELNIKSAANLANLAAGKVVEKWGTYALSKDELLDAMQQKLAGSQQLSTTKVLGLKQFLSLSGVKEKLGRIVFTNGCFDILHAGHVDYLEKAKATGDTLIVGLNSDESVRRLKGEMRPLNHYRDRARVLAGLGCVDFVIEFSEDTPLKLIEAIEPDILIKGADYNIESIVGAKEVIARGGSVQTIELTPGLSTSKLAERIRGL